ncbi:MAG: sugar ABC transporter permease [Spirochaetaceae bacterium]|nr:MAG: sugar ABC transporter permease [Spirochaetaceae bacterium]
MTLWKRIRTMLPSRTYRIDSLRAQLDAQSMVWPGLIFMFIFNFVPMYGVIIAFKDYSIIAGILEAPWAGMRHFQAFITNRQFYNALRNTLGINILGLVVGFPVPIIFALFLYELRSQAFKKLTQTISYLPHFLSWVVYGGLVISLLSTETGAVNALLLGVGLIQEPIFFLGEPRYFWAIAVITNITKTLGWSAILYLAAIAGVDPQLHEAGVIDGAGRFQRMWHITLPAIGGTVFILLIFSISNMLNWGFDQIWMLQNALNVSTSEIIDTYVYKTGLQQLRFSYAAAVGLSRSVVAVILLLFTNWLAGRFADRSLF